MFDGDIQHYIPAPVVETEAQRVLREMRAYLGQSRMWCKGQLIKPGGRVCIIGSMEKITGVEMDFFGSETERAIEKAIAMNGWKERTFHASGKHPIAAFNDHADTRHVDVLAVLDCARSFLTRGPDNPNGTESK